MGVIKRDTRSLDYSSYHPLDCFTCACEVKRKQLDKLNKKLDKPGTLWSSPGCVL